MLVVRAVREVSDRRVIDMVDPCLVDAQNQTQRWRESHTAQMFDILYQRCGSEPMHDGPS